MAVNCPHNNSPVSCVGLNGREETTVFLPKGSLELNILSFAAFPHSNVLYTNTGCITAFSIFLLFYILQIDPRMFFQKAMGVCFALKTF